MTGDEQMDFWLKVEAKMGEDVPKQVKAWYRETYDLDGLDSPMDVGETVASIRKAYKVFGGSPRPSERSRVRHANYVGSEREQMAASCVSALLAEHLGSLPDVNDFRRRLPGGNVLGCDASYHYFRNSPLTVLFSFDELIHLGFESTDRDFELRPISNRSRYRYSIRRTDPNVCVSVDRDPGDLLQIKWGPVALGTGTVEGALTNGSSVGLGRRFSESPRETWYDPWRRSRQLFNLPTFNLPVIPGSEDDQWYYAQDVRDCPNVFGFRGTIMGQALQIASDISAAFHIQVDDALAFLLCGRVPPVKPAEARMAFRPILNRDGEYRYSALISVIADAHPWTSSDGVIKELKQVLDPILTVSAASSKTTIKTITDVPVGTSLYGLYGTKDNISQTTTVKQASFSDGTYTLTITKLPASTAAGDKFSYSTTQRIRLPDVDTMKIYLFVEEQAPGQTRRHWKRLAANFNTKHGTKYNGSAFQQKYDAGRKKIENTLLPKNERATRNMEFQEQKARKTEP